ncbi:unnamed protein product [Gulo gulo]|uniref:Uncharacterized protein n=1 Tax=Gulo gulo TaxID=48420 RepID=A0A9X9M2R1_GULGU|nr:unnamed protein product [Gulo gulo]
MLTIDCPITQATSHQVCPLLDEESNDQLDHDRSRTGT